MTAREGTADLQEVVGQNNAPRVDRMTAAPIRLLTESTHGSQSGRSEAARRQTRSFAIRVYEAAVHGHRREATNGLSAPASKAVSSQPPASLLA